MKRRPEFGGGEAPAAKQARTEDTYVIWAAEDPAAVEALAVSVPAECLADLFFVSKVWHDKVLAQVASNELVGLWASQQPGLPALVPQNLRGLFEDFAIFRNTMSKTTGPRFGRIYHHVLRLMEEGHLGAQLDRWRSALQFGMRLNALASLIGGAFMLDHVTFVANGDLTFPSLAFGQPVSLAINDYAPVACGWLAAIHFMGRNGMTIHTNPRRREHVVLRENWGRPGLAIHHPIKVDFSSYALGEKAVARLRPGETDIYDIFLDPDQEPRLIDAPRRMDGPMEILRWGPWPATGPWPQATFRFSITPDGVAELEVLAFDVDIWFAMAASLRHGWGAQHHIRRTFNIEYSDVYRRQMRREFWRDRARVAPSLRFLVDFFAPDATSGLRYEDGFDDVHLAVAYGFVGGKDALYQDVRPMHYWKSMHCDRCYSAEVTCGDRPTATLYCADCAEKI